MLRGDRRVRVLLACFAGAGVICATALAAGDAGGARQARAPAQTASEPSGELVYSLAFRARKGSWIEAATLAGQDPRRITRPPAAEQRRFDESPIWSPGGDKIAFVRRFDGRPGWGLFVATADGRSVRKVFSSATGYGGSVDPMWSADGTGLWLNASACRVTRPSVLRFTVVRADGRGSRTVTVGPTSKLADAWLAGFSPDGRYVAYVLINRRPPEPGEGGCRGGPELESLYLADVDGRHPRDVDPTLSFENLGDIAWTPDSQRLAVSDCDVYCNVFVFDAASGPGSPLAGLPEDTEGGGDPMWSHDGEELFTTHDRALWATGFRTGQSRQLATWAPHGFTDIVATSTDGRFLAIANGERLAFASTGGPSVHLDFSNPIRKSKLWSSSHVRVHLR